MLAKEDHLGCYRDGCFWRMNTGPKEHQDNDRALRIIQNMTQAERSDAREQLKRVDGSNVLFDNERPKGPDEDEEPVSVP